MSFRELVGSLPAEELTHAIHPYPARLLRQIPRYLLADDSIMDGVEAVIDPFCGSGTVLLEARRASVSSIGIDQNPVAALVSRVKTQDLNRALAARAAVDVVRSAKQSRQIWEPPKFATRWFDPAALSVLGRLVISIGRSGTTGAERDYLDLCLALLARQIAATDKHIPVPVSPKERAPAVMTRDVWAAFERISATLAGRLEALDGLPDREPVVVEGDVRSAEVWSSIPQRDELILTSPPYGAAQKYVRSTSLELAWLGKITNAGTAGLERGSIGREHLSRSTQAATLERLGRLSVIQDEIDRLRDINVRRAAIYAAYFDDMALVLNNAHDRQSVRRLVLISGPNHVCGSELDTPKLLADLAESSGFKPTHVYRDRIRGRSLLTTRRGLAPAARYEQVEVFERG
ncbi:site-specific DNA-methyltransferase [Nocardioides baekrokdamisoli]|uniref:site-specific DNA-methyltransferase n=1 Tax=Nocardioides baekrokdamisoli TaxID=1804624 RepID=UPI0013DE1672|nr:site-specific DNA-methyltransferase [Nocardioides baekrokdamisoli]